MMLIIGRALIWINLRLMRFGSVRIATNLDLEQGRLLRWLLKFAISAKRKFMEN